MYKLITKFKIIFFLELMLFQCIFDFITCSHSCKRNLDEEYDNNNSNPRYFRGEVFDVNKSNECNTNSFYNYEICLNDRYLSDSIALNPTFMNDNQESQNIERNISGFGQEVLPSEEVQTDNLKIYIFHDEEEFLENQNALNVGKLDINEFSSEMDFFINSPSLRDDFLNSLQNDTNSFTESLSTNKEILPNNITSSCTERIADQESKTNLNDESDTKISNLTQNKEAKHSDNISQSSQMIQRENKCETEITHDNYDHIRNEIIKGVEQYCENRKTSKKLKKQCILQNNSHESLFLLFNQLQEKQKNYFSLLRKNITKTIKHDHFNILDAIE